MKLGRITCFLLDLDGTVYLGNRWIDGALEFLQALRQRGKRYCFLTNNSSRDRAAYVEKLAGMGLAVDPETQLVTSGQATLDYLSANYPGRRVFLLGNELLAREFREAGVTLDERDPELVVTAFDTSLTYEKMRAVCDFVRAGLPYVATHPDYNCPTETGFMPDIGAIHAFIHASAGRMPDFVVGKPNAWIMEYACRVTGTPKEQTAMVGDRLYTDIASAVGCGMTSVLVLSGEATREDLAKSSAVPDYVFGSVADLVGLV